MERLDVGNSEWWDLLLSCMSAGSYSEVEALPMNAKARRSTQAIPSVLDIKREYPGKFRRCKPGLYTVRIFRKGRRTQVVQVRRIKVLTLLKNLAEN